MPSEIGFTDRGTGMISSKKLQDGQILDLLDNECTTEDDLDDDYDEELEFAYQSDFQKKRPNKPCPTQSLLSNLFLTTAAASTEQCSSISKPQPIHLQKSVACFPNSAAPTVSTSPDSLSESLKRNIEWEHCQHSMKKYQQNQTTSNQDMSWTDNFSKW